MISDSQQCKMTINASHISIETYWKTHTTIISCAKMDERRPSFRRQTLRPQLLHSMVKRVWHVIDAHMFLAAEIVIHQPRNYGTIVIAHGPRKANWSATVTYSCIPLPAPSRCDHARISAEQQSRG
jgi:hypothetical protein